MKTKFFNRTYIILNIVLFVIAIVLPFSQLHILEMFLMAFPMLLYGAFFTIILLAGIFLYFFEKSKAVLITAIQFLLPLVIFIFFQEFSCFVVDKVQRFRCEKIIIELENNISLPENVNLCGIKYALNENGYALSYGRGFLVEEVYNSNTKKWKSYGWSD